MSRYVPMRPRAVFVDYSFDGVPALTADEVFLADEPAHEQTGLLDANGTPLYRVRDRRPGGFDLTVKPRVKVRMASREIP